MPDYIQKYLDISTGHVTVETHQTMTTYTVINSSTGEVIDKGVTAAEAAHIVLTNDGREYDIRPAEDGQGYELWYRQQVAGKGWTKTAVFSLCDDREEAEQDIYEQVVVADWPRHPEVLTILTPTLED